MYYNFDMYPKIFGFLDSYYVMIVIGVIFALIMLALYFKKRQFSRNTIIVILMNTLFAVLIGFIFALLFQNVYDAINAAKNGTEYHFSFGLTFYGGLIGGIGAFFGFYFLYGRKHSEAYIGKLLIIAPAAITIAHGIGRLGCFMEGCCYGIETTAWYGIYFPSLGKTVIPTQLFEAIFLLLSSQVFVFLAFKLDFKYTMPVYLLSYAIFRFLLEFIRGDYRGDLISGLSPSQFWCIVIAVAAIASVFLIRKFVDKNENIEKAS